MTSHPWSGQGSSDEPYTEPADPWSDHPTADPSANTWGGHPPSYPPMQQQPHGAAPLNAPPPAWGPPGTPPPRKKRNTPIVVLVVVLGFLICGGLGTTAWLIARDGDDTDAKKVNSTTPSTASETDQVTDPQPRSSEDARFVTKGQCVRNEGSTDKPEMKIVACASGTFEVLKRVDSRTTGEDDAEQKCSKVEGYTKWYFYDSELDSLDYVLCLKER